MIEKVCYTFGCDRLFLFRCGSAAGAIAVAYSGGQLSWLIGGGSNCRGLVFFRGLVL